MKAGLVVTILGEHFPLTVEERRDMQGKPWNKVGLLSNIVNKLSSDGPANPRIGKIYIMAGASLDLFSSVYNDTKANQSQAYAVMGPAVI